VYVHHQQVNVPLVSYVQLVVQLIVDQVYVPRLVPMIIVWAQLTMVIRARMANYASLVNTGMYAPCTVMM
jgi:hypothetical protein